MAFINLSNPDAMRQAIEDGLIWSAPMEAQDKACEMLASGEVPMPTYLPETARAQIARLKGVSIDEVQPAPSNDGSGPA